MCAQYVVLRMEKFDLILFQLNERDRKYLAIIFLLVSIGLYTQPSLIQIPLIEPPQKNINPHGFPLR